MDTHTNVRTPHRFEVLPLFFVLAIGLGGEVQLAQAQLNAELGIKAGRTFTTVSGADLSSEPSRRTGWTLAGTARLPLSDRFVIQSSVAYVQKGTRQQPSTSSEAVPIAMQMDYIEFPLMVGARWFMPADIAGRVVVGPAVGFNLSAKQTAGRSGADALPLRDQMRRTEVSAILGAGLDLDLNYQTIMIDVRYHRGLTALLEEPASSSLQNQGLSVTLGVAF